MIRGNKLKFFQFREAVEKKTLDNLLRIPGKFLCREDRTAQRASGSSGGIILGTHPLKGNNRNSGKVVFPPWLQLREHAVSIMAAGDHGHYDTEKQNQRYFADMITSMIFSTGVYRLPFVDRIPSIRL